MLFEEGRIYTGAKVKNLRVVSAGCVEVTVIAKSVERRDMGKRDKASPKNIFSDQSKSPQPPGREPGLWA